MEIPQGRGASKGKILKVKYELLTQNFPRGGGFKLKNRLWEGYGYFMGKHNLSLLSSKKSYWRN